MIGRVPTAELSALRAGDEVAGVYACTRKDRLTARTGTPYLALELRDRTSALPARVFRDADLLGGRFDRGDLVRVQGRVERFRDELQVEVRAIERAAGRRPGRVPAGRLPQPRRARRLPRAPRARGARARLPRAAGGAARATTRCAREWRRAPCTRDGHHAYLGGLLEHTVAVGDARAGDLPAAPAAELRPAADRGDRARPRQDARVHLRRGARAVGRGAAARPRRARPAAARAAAARPRARAARRAPALRALPTTGRTPRPAAASAPPRRSRSTASTRSTRASRARSSTGSAVAAHGRRAGRGAARARRRARRAS